ncbi:MAG TPA: tail fiber protein [Rhizomicrobium sp.]|nr:tail fiber protein [Rhizomicrobium sp.]
MTRALLAAALLLAGAAPASADYYGEVVPFALKFCPKGWSQAWGVRMGIHQNTALFSVLGSEYGGDYPYNFQLPDLKDHPPTMPDPSAKDADKLLWCIRTQNAMYPPRDLGD